MDSGVCVYVRTMHCCNRLQDFEDIEIESIWLKIQPHCLLRGTSSLLVAAAADADSSSTEERRELPSQLP